MTHKAGLFTIFAVVSMFAAGISADNLADAASKQYQYTAQDQFSGVSFNTHCSVDDLRYYGHLIFRFVGWDNGHELGILEYHLNLTDQNGKRVGSIHSTGLDVKIDSNKTIIVSHGSYTEHCLGEKPAINQHSGHTIDTNGNIHWHGN